eukprot:m.43280 g.43280  ORF g.43280 m.43280 type:complete len:201 (-) comp9962_c0_seq1:222-824(-)
MGDHQPPLTRAVIVPGNGCDGNVLDANWYGWLCRTLNKSGVLDEVVCKTMPDPYKARRSIWIPFMKDDLKIGQDTIAIGHSSGAVALMRFAEEHKVGMIVLVSACYTDLGEENERQAGYYPSPDGKENQWKFEAMKENCSKIFQFHSNDDPFIPLDEARRVQKELVSEENYFEPPNRSHFFDYPFPELAKLVTKHASRTK